MLNWIIDQIKEFLDKKWSIEEFGRKRGEENYES